ncbi:hypothetical protein PM082_018209 [Marasmius tenuissimus]|nr:hypothetical protein PM082_018209 [Marasmius tenuissimus]
MSTVRTQSPPPSTQSYRADTMELDRVEEGVELANLAVTSDTEGASQQIHEQAQTTLGHQNDESEVGSKARALEADLASGNPNVDNAAGGNSYRDAQENSGAEADLTYQLPPKVEKHKQSVELALQVSAVSLLYFKPTDLATTGTPRTWLF